MALEITPNRHRLSPMPQIVLLVLLAVLLLPWLGTTWFNSKGEPREAIVAVSILQSGNWILPVNYGGDIPFKPPFLAWLIAVLAKIFNGGEVNEYISRLPSALACIAMVWAGYRWSARRRGERFAMVMALVTVTSVEVLRAAVACRLDMVLTAAMLIALYQLFEIRERYCRYRGWRYLLVVLMMTVATMTKGPVGALLPGFVAGVYYLLSGERFIPTLLKMLGLCAASLILPLLWFYSAAAEGGDNFVSLMYEENFGRLTGTMSYESHVKPFWYNFVTLAAGFLPWTLLMLASAVDFRSMRRRALRPAGLLCLTTFVLVVLFYCIPASKRSVYLLPVYPAMAYCMSCIIMLLQHSKVLKAFNWLLAIIATVAPCAVMALLGGKIETGSLHLAAADWWQWPMLLPPIAVGVMWMLNRRDSISYTTALVYVLMLTYLAVIQPLALKPNSDKPFAADLAEAPAVYSLDSPEGIRYFTLNYYLGDRLRSISSADVDSVSEGTQILFCTPADSVVFVNSFEIRQLTGRASDYRGPLYVAVKSK